MADRNHDQLGSGAYFRESGGGVGGSDAPQCAWVKVVVLVRHDIASSSHLIVLLPRLLVTRVFGSVWSLAFDPGRATSR
jgi:hypothetical protein